MEENKVKGFVRDKYSNAVLSVDNIALQTYRAERARIMEQQRLSEEVKDLKTDLSDIKDLLSRLINRK